MSDDERDDAASSGRDRRRQTLIDAGTAAVVLLVVIGYGVVVDAEPRPVAVAGGAVAALAAEAVALADDDRHGRIRAVWERPSVRAGVVVFSLLTVGVGVRIAAGLALSFAGGALAAYLVLVVAHLTRRVAG